MRPVVLLTGSGSVSDQAKRPPPEPPDREQRSAPISAGYDYVDAVLQAGGAPAVCVNSTVEGAVSAALGAADALLLTGGGDLEPSTYGRRPQAELRRVDPVRDATELLAVRLAEERRMPILGICRGIQALCVALGGTLIQDIPSQVESDVNHDLKTDPPRPTHAVRAEENSIVRTLFGAANFQVNSRHHQAVEKPGDALRPTAWAPDGVIEAVESTRGLPILGLQCHPESLFRLYPEFLRPFRWLVEQAAARGGA